MKTYHCCSSCWKYYPPDQMCSVKQEMIYPILSHYLLKGLKRKHDWSQERSLVAGLNSDPGPPEHRAVICRHIRHPPASIWPQPLYIRIASPVVKHRTVQTYVGVELTILAVLNLVLHAVSGQLYVLVTVPQGKWSPVQEACWSSRAGLEDVASSGNKWNEKNNNKLSFS
jgi:hypothetical protein